MKQPAAKRLNLDPIRSNKGRVDKAIKRRSSHQTQCEHTPFLGQTSTLTPDYYRNMGKTATGFQIPSVRGACMIRMGQDKSRHSKAVKVWDKREYKNLDDSVELGTRNIKIALRRLRKWAREGVWLERLTRIYEHVIWLNPVPERHWDYTPSIQIMKQILSDRMYPLTLEGLDKAMRELNR
jgi:uncharacterized protein with von Willebrand factor type A (vWA) domain